MRIAHGSASALQTASILLLMTVAPAAASTFLKEDVDSLARKSHAVVHARVDAIDSHWNESATMIFTDVTLEVIRRIQGDADDRVVVRVPGGTVGDFTVSMDGAPRFVEGDEVVAFLALWGDGALMICGYEQGLSRVERDRAGNLLLRGGSADSLPLTELERHVRRAVR